MTMPPVFSSPSSSGETNLSLLLQSLCPILHEGIYVFCTAPTMDPAVSHHAIGTFREPEGWTLILPQTIADAHSYAYTVLFAWITLDVHSSLEAIGLTASFSHTLAHAGLSCNVIAGYYHDHIFVPYTEREKALHALQALSQI